MGGICAGSVTDMVKIRFKHEWHMRWPQESFAVRKTGTSSAPQVRQSTTLGFAGGEERNMEASSELFFPHFFEGAALLTVSRLDKAGLDAVGVACEVDALRSNVGLRYSPLDSSLVETLLECTDSFETVSSGSRRYS